MYKIILRLWLVLWVITLPLVHIHPEADHAHAGSGHVRGGIYHSILVNTPVHAHHGYDQEEHHHDGFFFLENGSGSTHSESHPPYDFEEATYGFSVIKPSPDTDSNKTEISHALVVGAVSYPAYSGGHSKSLDFLEHQHFSILLPNLSPRAPPFLSIYLQGIPEFPGY